MLRSHERDPSKYYVTPYIHVVKPQQITVKHHPSLERRKKKKKPAGRRRHHRTYNVSRQY